MAKADKPQSEKKGKAGRPRAAPVSEFGRWFASMSTKGHVSTEDIAGALGCSPKYAMEIITGRRGMSLEGAVNLMAMAKLLELKRLKPEDFLPDDPPRK